MMRPKSPFWGSATAAVAARPGPVSATINAALFEAGSHGLRVDSAYIQLVKAVLTFEGMAQQLDPGFDLESALREHAVKAAFAKLAGKLFR